MNIALPATVWDYTIHPIARACPAYTIEQFEELKSSLAKDGQREPIVLFDGEILDGAHRLYALELLGIHPKFAFFAGTEIEAVQAVFIANVLRRHLTTAQRAQAVLDHEKLDKAARTKESRDLRRGSKKPSRSALSKRFGVSERTVQKVANVRRRAVPAVRDALRNGALSIDEAQRISRKPVDLQCDALDAALHGEVFEEDATTNRLPMPSAKKRISVLFDEFLEATSDTDWDIDDLRSLIEEDPVCFITSLDHAISKLKIIRKKAVEIDENMLQRSSPVVVSSTSASS